MVKLLVGNKVDKAAVVSREDAEDWARARGMLFLEASAKTDVGIAQASGLCIRISFFKMLTCMYIYLRGFARQRLDLR